MIAVVALFFTSRVPKIPVAGAVAAESAQAQGP